MSYLNAPRLHFSGKFRADPSTLNNTPNNYDPKNEFPTGPGAVEDNIELYWNPDGTAMFQLDCTVTKVCYADGSSATTSHEDSLVGKSLFSMYDDRLNSGRVVDLDPMQQNVTELWGLEIGIGASRDKTLLSGRFKPAAYTNAWVPIFPPGGDFDGSAFYQSVLELDALRGADGDPSRLLAALGEYGARPELSIGFVLRAFNSSSHEYLLDGTTLPKMLDAGVPVWVLKTLAPLTEYRKHPKTPAGLIPTTSYFTKLLKELLDSETFDAYQADILSIALQPYKPATEFDFTYGQVFGSIGLRAPGEPEFVAPKRMLTPTAVQKTPKKPAKPSMPTDMGKYGAYFAPCTVNSSGSSADGGRTWVTVNLGNSLPSTKPASMSNSHVDTASLKKLLLCCFPDGLGGSPKLLGEIAYEQNEFYVVDAGVVDVPIDPADVALVERYPLGVVSVDASGAEPKIVLQENPGGNFVRANKFVYRMNPGAGPDELNPDTATVEFYASRFGRPLPGVEIQVSMLSPEEAASYSDQNLGTGQSLGELSKVLSVPQGAVELNGKTGAPATIKTNAEGIASLSVKGLDPCNPRVFLDGQIYLLRYGFKDASVSEGYVQSPDDLVSLQVYDAQPDRKDVTWKNFVGKVLAQYGKIYPVMSHWKLGDKDFVIEHADTIRKELQSSVEAGKYMPVTRDMSGARLELIVGWLEDPNRQ